MELPQQVRSQMEFGNEGKGYLKRGHLILGNKFYFLRLHYSLHLAQ